MRQSGYAVVRSIPELEAAQSTKIIGFMSLAGDSDDKIVSVTGKALQLLGNNKKGFFLTDKCRCPDHGGHSHDSSAIVDGIRQLDYAVKEALEFAQKERHTLVLVTADHETGGLVLSGKGKHAEICEHGLQRGQSHGGSGATVRFWSARDSFHRHER